MYDTVGGWSSVSYFNRQDYEKDRYSQAVGLYLPPDENLKTFLLTRIIAGLSTLWERTTDIQYYFISTIQSVIIELGLIVAGVIVVYQIAGGNQKVGSFAMVM